jgi:hypothetical protein
MKTSRASKDFWLPFGNIMMISVAALTGITLT